MRKDLHRPSVIRPDDYTLIGFRYIGPDTFGISCDDKARIEEHRQRTGGFYSGHEHGGTCGICGAWAHTLGVFHHVPSNTYIMAGEDCAHKLDLGEDIAFKSFRKRIAAGLEMARGKAKAQTILSEEGLSAAWDIFNGDSSAYEERTIRDIVGNLIRYGSLSEKQVAFIRKLLAQIPEREEKKAIRAAENSASQYIGNVGDRLTITLNIDWIKNFEGNFGPITIVGLRDKSGNIVIYKGSAALGEKGEAVTVKATIKAHNEREGVKQTIISRPSKA